jgi:2-dehydro-3-deoxygalactonokinase
MMREGPTDGAPFDAGVRRAGDPGGLLHHIFGARAEVLAGRLAETDAAAYLSGILIGHEVRAALAGRPNGATGVVVHVIGAQELTALYARAISACGGFAERHDGEAAARGLVLIGGHAAWN